MSDIVLDVDNLHTHFFTRRGLLRAVDGISFQVHKSEVVGLIGESGSGKSVTGFSIMRLVDAPGRIVEGQIRFLGHDLASLTERQMRNLRGSRIAMIFQDPMMTLNPVLRIDTQMIDAVLAHDNVSKAEARIRARDALGKVGIPSPEERLKAYPHQFSGGMRQRVAIAIAMLHKPELLIADEPTTALDVTIQGEILSEMQKLCKESGTSLIWITHDLAVVAGLAHSICVMYAGKIVEYGPVDDVLDRPLHPYTQGLLRSIPGESLMEKGKPLKQIPGSMPSLLSLPPGCAFAPRCEYARPECQNPVDMRTRDKRSVRCLFPLVHNSFSGGRA